MNERTSDPRGYFTAVAMLNDMMQSSLIDETDYCALETKYAALFLPLFRYEKPCKSGSVPIRQCEQKGA